MAVKHFIISPNINSLGKETIQKIQSEKEFLEKGRFEIVRGKDKEQLQEEDTLKYIKGRVIIKIDLDSKDQWTFENGQTIQIRRRFNNFNNRVVQPVNAFVIDAEYIPKGAEILIHFNAIHDTYRIFDYKNDNGNIRYYSIPEDMCFAWFDGEEYQPLKTYDFALRIFKPYEGLISNIPPTQIKDCLFITTGDYKNAVVKTLVASDFEIIFQSKQNREQSIIRLRPNGDEQMKREPECICILNNLTELVHEGKLLVGLTPQDAKPLDMNVAKEMMNQINKYAN